MKAIVILFTVLSLVLAGCSGGATQVSYDTNLGVSDTTVTYTTRESGYKIGDEIPAGEYYLEANIETDSARGVAMGYYGLSNSSITSEMSLTLMGVAMNGTYLTLDESDGYLLIDGITVYPANEKPVTQLESDGSYKPGEYKVGVDIPVGTYNLVPIVDNMNASGYVIYSDSTHSDGSTIDSNEVTDSAGSLVTVEDGQYLETTFLKIIPQ